MSGNEDFGPELDRATNEIRNEQIDPALVEEAAGRVWAKITDAKPRLVEHIHSCADFQALIPDYRAGKLTEARALLLKDHTHECVACRKALETASGKVTAFPGRQERKRIAPVWRWAVAATVLVGAGLTAWGVWNIGPQFASRTTIQAVNGSLFRLAGQSLVPVTAGQILSGGEEIRTGKDSGAMVQLGDGSRVEMRERSAFRVTEGLRDMTVHLNQGSVIVQAAKRRTGHLYVTTRDCRVAVTGTVFSVNSGLKGSRVSVVEGEVHVAQAGKEAVLHAGDQYTSGAAVEPVPVQQEIAWSRNLDQHIAMLKTMKALDKRLTDNRFPQVRHSSELLHLLPANTAVFASIPNLTQALTDAQEIFGNRAQENAALRQWWEEGQPKMSQVIERLKAVNSYLGNEIVMAAIANETGKVDAPVFLAELKNSGFRAYLDAELAKLPVEQRSHVTVVEKLGDLPAVSQGMLILAQPGLVAISPNAHALRQIGGAFETKSKGGFDGTPFGMQVLGMYAEGAGLLFSADLEKFGAIGRSTAATPFMPKMKYFTIEQAGPQEKPEMRAVLGFAGQRSGIASWLAAPSPMGVLQFITPEASLVAAAAVKAPSEILDEVVKWQASARPDAPQTLAALESKLGISVRNDLIAPLGGEFAVALDGPALPIPSWKVVAEVTDPQRLQAAFTRLINAANAEMTAHGRPPIQVSSEDVQGMTFHMLKTSGATVVPEIHYVFTANHMIAAPSRALLKKALKNTENSIGTSAGFQALLPRDGHLNVSAVMYQNLGSTLAPMADIMGAAKGLTAEQQQGIKSIAAEMKPMLIATYADEDRITVASSSSLLGLGLNQFSIGRFFGHGPRRGTQKGTAR